jgi:carnosine N-methyltransferase
VQGNEFSFHMLLASDFILNACTADRPFRIAPWLGPTRNLVSSLDTTRQISIPDVDPVSMLDGDGEIEDEKRPEFSMAAGEFAGVYSKESEHEQWDGVVSCFFLDTAPSIVEYLQIIWNMLKEGGLLFNFGPLLYHWSAAPARPNDKTYYDYKRRLSHMDKRYAESIDLSWEEVKQVMCSIGFEIVEEQQDLPATYTADDKCMMNSRFDCIFFVAKKVAQKS